DRQVVWDRLTDPYPGFGPARRRRQSKKPGVGASVDNQVRLGQFLESIEVPHRQLHRTVEVAAQVLQTKERVPTPAVYQIIEGQPAAARKPAQKRSARARQPRAAQRSLGDQEHQSTTTLCPA